MKKILFALTIGIMPFVCNSQGVNLIYSFTNYVSTDNESYVAVNTSIDASSIEYVQKDNGKYQAELEMTLIVYTDTLYTKAMYAEKKIVLSPEIASPESRNFISLYDIQKVSLPNGTYPFYLKVKDKNSSSKFVEARDKIIVNYTKDDVTVSGITLVSSFEKTKTNNVFGKPNGYDIYPYLFEKLTAEAKQMTVYAEIYNVDKLFGNNAPYIINVAIEDYNTSKVVAGVAGKRTKTNAKNMETVFETLNITDLPKGFYNVTVEVRDTNNMLYADRKYAFYKDGNSFETFVANDETYLDNITDINDLIDDIESLYPLANKIEREFIDNELHNKTIEQLRNFLYGYWANNYAINPEEGYREYHKRALYAKQHFTAPTKKAYYTDMGRVYMIYGEPDNIIDERYKQNTGIKPNNNVDLGIDPDIVYANTTAFTYLPYQMWRYNQTPFGEANRTFVFYAPMNNISEYRLLHSDAKGETTTLFWERVLSRNILPEYTEGDAGVQFKRGY
ncbi:MAG: GWxTD domain-containing protein [Bacteroidales bacterium]|jgi:GWxTD domain-containing protein|nr:GWxTD domain-containing protein [Bacteroidales bacterium]